MTDFGTTHYILSFIGFIIVCNIYGFIYNGYANRVICKQKVRFHLPDKWIVYSFLLITMIFVLTILQSFSFYNQLKDDYESRKIYIVNGYVSVNDRYKLSQFLENNPDLDINDTDALLVSVNARNLEMTKFLIDLGADPNQKIKSSFEHRNEQSIYNTTVFHIAVQKNDIEMVKLLLENGANPHSLFDPLPTGNNPIYQAIQHQNLELLKLMIEKELSLENESTDYLMTAASIGNIEIFEYLIDQGLEVNRYEEFGVLYIAVMYNNFELADHLIEHYDLEMKHSYLKSIIEIDKTYFEERINYSISKGVHYNDLDELNHPIWVISSLKSQAPLKRLNYFKMNGVNLYYENEEGQNLIHLYIRLFNYNPNMDVLEGLIDLGVDPNKLDVYGKKPIDYLNMSEELNFNEYKAFFEAYE